jgi:hypothetical protein
LISAVLVTVERLVSLTASHGDAGEPGEIQDSRDYE